MKLTLCLTDRCNLSCAYCYGGRKKNVDMPFDVACKAIDLALEKTSENQELKIGFCGGEPLLCFETLKRITRYARSRALECNRSVSLSLTTNGTLLTDEVLEFLRLNQIGLRISMDGPESVHDQHRRFPDGQGSHKIASTNLGRALERLDSVQVNAVFGPDNLDTLAETLVFLIWNNVRCIHLTPDMGGEWTQESIRKVDRVFRQLAEVYIKAYRQGREITVNLIDTKMVLFMKGGYSCDDINGIGKTELAVAPSGNIYPCERFTGDDSDESIRLGNVLTGYVEPANVETLKNRGCSNAECRGCGLLHFCMNWCGCTSYRMNGDTDRANAIICAFERAAIRAANRAFNTLVSENNQLMMDHLLQHCGGEYCFN